MPEISRFFGIIVRMFSEPSGQHQAPHFHVIYQDQVAVYTIDPIDLISRSIPRRQQRLIEAWAELHQAELMADWARLKAGQLPVPIPPLA